MTEYLKTIYPQFDLKTPEDIYNDLMELVGDGSNGFYFVDHLSPNGQPLRVFAYHVASYSDWLNPSALEARGIMFEINTDGSYKEIVSRPMEKFFNVNENPFTMVDKLLFERVDSVMDKVDGSLISTYKLGDQVGLKSKTSITSAQALAASRYLKEPVNAVLYDFCHQCAQDEVTVNMEWVAPNNRIVLEYSEARLVILNLRDNITGEYISFDDIPNAIIQRIKPWLVAEYDPSIASDPDFLENIKGMAGIEGVIVRMANHQHVKLKTQWYVDLHQTKDSISLPKRLVKTILNNNHDDLYALFSDDQATIDRIREFEMHVVGILKSNIKQIQTLWTNNRHKERKFYAIDGQKELPPWLFGVYMQMYSGFKDPHGKLVDVYLRRPELLVPEKYLQDMKEGE